MRSYIELRGEDAAPGSKSSYRITVRQLEALVRLSEAAARARCSDHIQEEHVREAKRLLRSSILKIEQNDIEFEEEELEEAVPAPGDEAMPDAAPAEQAAAGGGEPAAAAEGAQPARRKVQVRRGDCAHNGCRFQRSLLIVGCLLCLCEACARVTSSQRVFECIHLGWPVTHNVTPCPQIDVKKYNAVKVMLMRRLVAQVRWCLYAQTLQWHCMAGVAIRVLRAMPAVFLSCTS